MKKNLLKSVFIIYFLTLSFFAPDASGQTGGVSINNTNTPAHPSAIFDVSSSSPPYMGILIPRMSTANRNSIVSPAVGLQVFNTDCGINEYYTGTCWVSMGQILKTPSHITCSGTTDFCANESRTFTILAVTGATNYEWTVPAGAAVISGQGTTSATVLFGNHSGDVCVTAENICEASPIRCIDVFINPVPPIPGNITGPTTVVPNSSANYFIASVTGAGVYNWTVPAGATITSGVGTTTITINFSCSAVSGNISVTAQSNCGNSSANTLGITMNSLTANAGPPVLTPGALGGSPTASGGAGSYIYAWLPSTDLSSTTVANPTSSVCLLTTYTLTVTDANGCTASSSTTASSANQAQPVSTFTPPTGTRGFPVTFTPATTSGVTWSWTFTDGSPSSSTAQNPSVTWSATGTYNVSLTVTFTSTGCSSTTTNQVVISAPPTTCQDILTANPSAPSGVYVIDPGNGAFQVYCDMTTDGGGWTLVENTGPKYTNNMIAASSGSTPILPTQTSFAKLSDADINAIRGSYTTSLMKVVRPFICTPYVWYFQQNLPFNSTAGGHGSGTIYTYYTSYSNAINNIGLITGGSSYQSAFSTWGDGNYGMIFSYNSEGFISDDTLCPSDCTGCGGSGCTTSRSSCGVLLWIK